MTQPLKERLVAVTERLDWSEGGPAIKPVPINPDGPEALARIEVLEDSNEGLTEDLYQAVLVAYRRGAHEWAWLNYPQWRDALAAGREVCPARSALNEGG